MNKEFSAKSVLTFSLVLIFLGSIAQIYFPETFHANFGYFAVTTAFTGVLFATISLIMLSRYFIAILFSIVGLYWVTNLLLWGVIS